ncbi:MAG: translation initiation factor IF-3 [Solitalea-like symbiont of Acarus siro]
MNQGVYATKNNDLALAKRKSLGYLSSPFFVLISTNVDPPICRIIEYDKFLSQQKKKKKALKSRKVEVKELRFGPNTDEHDFNFKLKHAQGFLEKGDKVKVSLFFKGRTIKFTRSAGEMLLKFADDLKDFGKPEQMPKLEGKRLIFTISQKSKK